LKILLSIVVPALAASAAVLFAQPAASQGAWKCSAPGLISGNYDGGSTAYIHLQGFPSGGSYAVTKSGNVASGVTANGTRFTCRR
jgi:hypothetical protein